MIITNGWCCCQITRSCFSHTSKKNESNKKSIFTLIITNYINEKALEINQSLLDRYVDQLSAKYLVEMKEVKVGYASHAAKCGN